MGIETTLPLEMLIKEFSLFDADTWQAMSEKWTTGITDDSEDYEKSPELRFNPEIDTYDEFTYYRRHLDGPDAIDVSHILGYLSYCIRKFGYQKNTEYTKQHAMQQNRAGADNDDDDILLESDEIPIFSGQITSATELTEVLNVFAYHLKRIFNLGCSLEVNMLSLICAGEKAIATRNATMERRTTKGLYSNYTITQNKCIEEGIYMCTPGGTSLDKFTIKQKSKKLDKAFDIYKGRLPAYTSYTDDIQYIVSLAKKLHIDLTKTDPTKYDRIFHMQLSPDCLITDDQYLKVAYERVTREPKEIFKAYLKKTMKNVREAMRQHVTLKHYNENFYKRDCVKQNLEDVIYDLKKFNKLLGSDYAIDKYLHFENEIAYLDSNPYILDISSVYKQQPYGGAKAIITRNGLVFPITGIELFFTTFKNFYYIYVKTMNDEPLTNSDKDCWGKLYE